MCARTHAKCTFDNNKNKVIYILYICYIGSWVQSHIQILFLSLKGHDEFNKPDGKDKFAETLQQHLWGQRTNLYAEFDPENFQMMINNSNNFIHNV